jgi:hypothetical protein
VKARGEPAPGRLTAGRWLRLALVAALLAAGCGGHEQRRGAQQSAAAAEPARSPVGDRVATPENTGVPAGWTPARTRSRDLVVSKPGAVIQDIRFTRGAKLTIDAKDVTVRDVELRGGWIETDGQPGVVIQDTTFDRLDPETNGGEGVISYCGYTAVRVAILDRNEGFRESGCDAGTPTTIRDSFVRITPPAGCTDWHGDGVQGFDGTNLHIENLTIDFHETPSCGGTSPFFYNGGAGGSPHGHVHIDGLLIKGGGYSFRMGTRGSVRGLKIVSGSWRYAPIDITDAGCGAISPWDARIVDVDAGWHVTRTVRTLDCSTDAG